MSALIMYTPCSEERLLAGAARELDPYTYRSPTGDGGAHVQHLNPKHGENPGIISAASPSIARQRSNAVVLLVDWQEA